MDTEVLLARQPILDAERRVVAYELLFRGANPGADAASSRVLLNAFEELDIDSVVGRKPAFVNFTRSLIFNPPPFDQRRFVIEVLEDIKVDDELIRRVRELRKQHFRIALDDFVYHEHKAPLVEHAEYIKLDVLAQSDEAIGEQVRQVAKFGKVLIAEKVETLEQFQRCQRLGFHLFQGFFFARPELVHGERTPTTKQAVLRLLSALANPDITYEALKSVVASDAVMSIKLLRLVNSAALNRGDKIHSLTNAIALLGMDRVKSWGSLLALSQLADNAGALLQTSLMRAMFCEAIGKALSSSADQYFTCGLLSNLEAFVQRPLAQLLADLRLSDPVHEALTKRTGALGLALRTAVAYERAEWTELPLGELVALGLDASDIAVCHRAALRATDQLMSWLADIV